MSSADDVKARAAARMRLAGKFPPTKHHALLAKEEAEKQAGTRVGQTSLYRFQDGSEGNATPNGFTVKK